MSPLMEIESLTKHFGAIRAVDDVTFSVERGEVLGFLGPNGAGKSTTMKIIAGFLSPSSGSVRVAGVDVRRKPREAQRRLGYLPEGSPLYGDMTPEGFLDFVARAREMGARERRRAVDEVIDRLRLGEVLRRRIDTLSKGFRRRVGVAQAILHDPEVLILDEPTDGLDPNQKQEVRALIRAMSGTKAIIISTHILEEVDTVCDRAIIIDRGRIVLDSTPEELYARAPGLGAVSVRVVPGEVERARTLLGGMEGVATVDVGDTLARRVQLVVRLNEPMGLAKVIEGRLRDGGFTEPSVRVLVPRLDEVFRAATAEER